MLQLFDIIPPPGQFGHDTRLEGSADYTGHGNVDVMTVTPELGHVYAPTSTPTDDWYGGHRPATSSSSVALDARRPASAWWQLPGAPWSAGLRLPAALIPVDVTVDGGRQGKQVSNRPSPTYSIA